MAKFRQPPQSAAEATIVSKAIAANGTYYASADNADGYDPVVVEVPGEHATIVSKNITANGTYDASADSADGYNPVTVAVPEKVIVSKSITANGTYNASQDSADGFDPVVVAVPAPVIKSKSITANGTYNASSDNADGFDPVVVAVPGPVLGTKSISANGTYTAAADGYDGFSSVTVAVSGGAQATITVSYDSYFYDKTMTCSDGITTYTETTTSAGSTVFSVNASGTWTISCNGQTQTVEVVIDYTTTMIITKTISVYGPASDTISFTDYSGSKTVTTDVNGAGSVQITIMPPSANITFTSNVAKNPSNLGSAYSKQITIDGNTTAVYVMPDNTLYWYGYRSNNFEVANTSTGWTWTGRSFVNPTFNINSVTLNTGLGEICMLGNTNAISTSKAICIGRQTSIGFELKTSTNKDPQTTIIYNAYSESSSDVVLENVSNVSNGYISFTVQNTMSAIMSALWYE